MCTYNLCQVNKCVFFTISFFLANFSTFLVMCQYNELVEINNILCCLACTWTTILDSHFYIIDS